MRLPTPLRESRLMRFARRFDFSRLHREEGGNVMVMYIAAALLLVGMLWAIIGTGARVVQKETLQASADAAAFSAAVIKAKGMNIVAFCNLLLALLLAIVIILRLLKDALILASVLLSVASIFAPPLAALATTVSNIANQYSNVEKKIEEGILKAMKGVAAFERGVAKAIPALSLVQAYQVGTHSAYQKNMGSGTLVTVTLPLPLGKDLSLPTKDGTWDTLCTQAKLTMGRILGWIISKVVGDTIASWLQKAFNMIMTPFVAAVCGGGTGDWKGDNIEQIETDCHKCATGDATSTEWSCQAKGGGGGQFGVEGFPGSADCSGGGFTYKDVEYTSCTFVRCSMKKKYEVSGNSTAIDKDKCKPLELADDWLKRTTVRGFTVLTQTNIEQRRRSVGVARKGGAGKSPLPVDALLTMAQAEFFSFNHGKAADLWHMDWRARLMPFTMTNDTGSGSGTGDTTGQVTGDMLSKVSGAISGLINSEAGQTLSGQFLVH